VIKTSISDTNTSYVIHWCKLDQWLSAAVHVTCQSSSASISWHHGSSSSSEHCCIVIQIL